MDKNKYTHLIISYGVVCITVLCMSDLFATPSVFEGIKEVEAIDKLAPSESIQRPNIVYNASDLRDPFESYIKKGEHPEDGKQSTAVFANQQVEKAPPSLTVQGLVWGGNFPQAIINNKVVRIRRFFRIISGCRTGNLYGFSGCRLKRHIKGFINAIGLKLHRLRGSAGEKNNPLSGQSPSKANNG